MELIHYTIQVFGKVQGVWFRKYTKDKADEFGIVGYVQNEPDGNVFIEAEASQEVLREFVEWLYQGSPLSKVTKVVFTTGKVQNFKGFKIRKTKV